MNKILDIFIVLTFSSLFSNSQILTIRESKFYLDPSVIKANQFKLVELDVHEYYFVHTKSSDESERKSYNKYRLRFFMNSTGFPDSVHYFGYRLKKDRHWIQASLQQYYEFLPDSLRTSGKSIVTYNSSGLISRQEFSRSDFHDCCNPKISISKYSYNIADKINSIEFIEKNSTPAQVVDSTRFEFNYMNGIQEVRKTSLKENLKSSLFCFDKDQIIQQIVVFDSNVNDASVRIRLTYRK